MCVLLTVGGSVQINTYFGQQAEDRKIFNRLSQTPLLNTKSEMGRIAIMPVWVYYVCLSTPIVCHTCVICDMVGEFLHERFRFRLGKFYDWVIMLIEVELHNFFDISVCEKWSQN
jgi:hypothetical protein